MTDINEVIKAIIDFRDQRSWAQFHNSKDLALALSIEASELNELFLWKKSDDVNEDMLKEELADVLNYALLIAHKHNFDIKEIILDKLKKNAEKYPVSKSLGSAKKYDEL